MRTPALVVGLAVGFIFASLVSCGTAPKCTATTCPTGCCDSSGLCQTGSSASACGSRGTACSACGVTASCVAGACMQNISGSGGGTSGTGGGTSGTGGGTSGTGGGTSGTGGGTSGTGGGTSGTGGGTSGTGGGTSGTGGGTSGTGGGSAGGSAGNSTVFCNRLLAAQTRFFAGRSSCPGAITLTPAFNATACNATWNVCTEADHAYLNQIASCLESAPVCTTGNESAASSGFLQCLSLTEALSAACAASLQGP